jgi:hypothetical protein
MDMELSALLTRAREAGLDERTIDLAEQGDATAQYNLGVYYRDGEGVENDPVEAVAWYRKAADQGHADAQFNLGRCYQYGVGVERDLVEAGAWYRKANRWDWETRPRGVADSLSTLYDDCSDDDTETVETVALYRKGAEQGLGSAQYHLGRCYQYGAGVERDLVEAAAWYQKAAEQRIFNAAYELGVMYANARGVPKDDAEAVRWYRFAAGQGSHAKAKHNLKVMYADGRAVPEDEDEDGWKHDDATIDF